MAKYWLIINKIVAFNLMTKSIISTNNCFHYFSQIILWKSFTIKEHQENFKTVICNLFLKEWQLMSTYGYAYLHSLICIDITLGIICPSFVAFWVYKPVSILVTDLCDFFFKKKKKISRVAKVGLSNEY